MYSSKRTLARTVISAAILAATTGFAFAEGTLKVGLLSILEGPFAVPGQDGIRGAELALKQKGGTAGGMKIELISGSSDGNPDKAVAATRKLVEQDKVQIMIGPLSGDEGIAVKNYAKTQAGITFVNGSSGPYSQVQGFMASYCAKGGKVVDKAWVPLGTKDYASVIAKIPKDVDALLVVLGGSDAVNFLTQYEQAGGTKPMVGGSITVDQTVLNYKGKRRESLVGTASAGPMADSLDTAEWKKFVADYKANFKDGFPSPSLFAYLYYINTKAALDGLDAVKGDLSGGQKKYREALQKTKFVGPAGEVVIDANRNGVGPTYITEVTKAADGSLFNKVVKTVPNITQTLGLPEAEFKKMGLGTRDIPDCRK
ncbi:MAG: ABC transporter substrate-binding protein [Betaproteobacteria bacterium]|nr:ABC transporter substrate-binding protein [Betaproteobacteria bacterium]